MILSVHVNRQTDFRGFLKSSFLKVFASSVGPRLLAEQWRLREVIRLSSERNRELDDDCQKKVTREYLYLSGERGHRYGALIRVNVIKTLPKTSAESSNILVYRNEESSSGVARADSELTIPASLRSHEVKPISKKVFEGADTLFKLRNLQTLRL